MLHLGSLGSNIAEEEKEKEKEQQQNIDLKDKKLFPMRQQTGAWSNNSTKIEQFCVSWVSSILQAGILFWYKPNNTAITSGKILLFLALLMTVNAQFIATLMSRIPGLSLSSADPS